MRRLMTFLLALMLPCAAMAEVWHAEAAIEVNETLLTELLTAVLSDESTAGKLPAAIAKSLNGSGISISMQEDALSFVLTLGHKTLIDFQVFVDADRFLITSSMMQGYALMVPYEMEKTGSPAVDTDWAEILLRIAEGIQSAPVDIEHTSKSGAFAGDAYSGGVYCEQIVLDDSDIALLLDSMLTPELRDVLAQLLSSLNVDAAAFLVKLDDLNAKAASDNAHTYIIRLVEDREHDLIGASLTIIREGSQIATLSIGLRGDSMQIVLGTGQGDVNLWYDHTVSAVKGDHSCQFAGTCRQFTGEKDEAYTYAAAISTDLLSLLNWALDITNTEDGLQWSYLHEATGSRYPLTEGVVCTGEWAADTNSITSTLTLMADGSKMSALTFCAAPSDEKLPEPDSTLLICDISSTDEEQLQLQSQMMDMLIQVLTARLLSILPLELFLMP